MSAPEVAELVWRDATAADVPAVGRLVRAAFDPAFGEAWSDAQLAGGLALPGGWLELALDGDALAGFALLRRTLDEVELLLCATDPARRCRGVGRALLTRAARRAAAEGGRRMFLEVRENNAAAQALYRSLGFAAVGRRRAYYRGADGRHYDAVTFDLPLP